MFSCKNNNLNRQKREYIRKKPKKKKYKRKGLTKAEQSSIIAELSKPKKQDGEEKRKKEIFFTKPLDKRVRK